MQPKMDFMKNIKNELIKQKILFNQFIFNNFMNYVNQMIIRELIIK